MLVRALPGWAEVESDAVAFVVAAEDRLMLALEGPEGTQAQPLTLGALQVRACVCALALTSILTGAISSIGSLQLGDYFPDSIRSKHAKCSSHAAALQGLHESAMHAVGRVHDITLCRRCRGLCSC